MKRIVIMNPTEEERQRWSRETLESEMLSPWRTFPHLSAWHLHLGKDAKFTGYKVTGTWGAYCRQTRHYWFGVTGIINIRRSVSWG
jgi:hypothetical protein